MPWILIGGYILAHFLLYLFVFRHRPFFWSERGIFLFHFVPALILATLMFGAFVWRPSSNSFALFVGASAACGIYSLSFLECWVLSEGGYSLRILSELVRRETVTSAELEVQFVDMSARKKIGRLDWLLGLGLVKTDADRFRVSARGGAVATVMSLIARLVGFRVPS